MLGNAYGNNICLFDGIGGGQFTVSPISPIVIGNGPHHYVVADLNNDGQKDLAINRYYMTNQVAIYNHTSVGNYTQAAGSPIATGNQPYVIDAADFNMDGNMDLVTCNANSGTTYVLIGNGSSQFTVGPGSPYTTGNLSRYVCAGYFNADNFPDWALVNANTSQLIVMLGNGTGSFTSAPGSPYTTVNTPNTISVKDLNNDGHSDMVVACAGASLNVFMGSASGSFTQAPGSPMPLASGLWQASIADYDLNGTYDLVMSGGNSIWLLSGNGNGTFSVPTYSVINGFNTPFFIATDDYNNDGRPDFAVEDWIGTNLYVYLNTSTVCAVSASYNYSTGAQGAVNFTSTSTGTTALTTYSWNYGDSSGGTGSATSHTYSSNGSYIVILTVTNSTVAPACMQTYSSVVTVTNACSINQSFTYTNNTGGSYNFSSASTGTNASTVYSWNFGDSSTGSGQSTTHTYTSNGTYTVSFTVVNTSTPSCFVTNSAVITVTDACSIMGSFSYTTNGAAVNFASAVTGTTSGAIFNWDFADASTGSGPTINHTYTTNGVYTVTLTVINLTNPPCSKTYTQTVTITNVGLKTFGTDPDLKIYPNPASDKLFVELNGNLNSQLIIYSAIGQELLRTDLTENKTEIKLDHLSSGFYYYSVKNNSNTIRTGPLIINR
jgi:PKD repeat protein